MWLFFNKNFKNPIEVHLNLCYNHNNPVKGDETVYEKLVPGTVMSYASIEGGMFSLFRPMIAAADGLSLGQVSALTGLKCSTVQNWVKRGYVAHPVQKKYYERQLARILLISALRDCLKIDRIASLMQMVNGNVEDVRDDIISEAKLYDYLCEAVRQLDLQHHSREQIEAVIQRVTADYEGPNADATGRLHAALLIMVCAYLSGVLKKEAELYFEQMKLGGI